MTAEQFIAHWKGNKMNEKSGAQQYFSDLCDLLDVDKPRNAAEYCYERDAKKASGGMGWADVWKRGCFSWENKKPGARPQRRPDMQLTRLRPVNWETRRCSSSPTGNASSFIPPSPDTPTNRREIRIEELADPGTRQLTALGLHRSRKSCGRRSRAPPLTEEAAGHFASHRQVDAGTAAWTAMRVAHFLVQCLFCMFAEDEGLLHEGTTEDRNIFTGILKSAGKDPERARTRIASLFTAMQGKGGQYGNDDIAWFNGGLFNSTVDVPALTVGRPVRALRRRRQP